MGISGFWGRLAERLTESPVDSDAKELAGSARESGCSCVSETPNGSVATVKGRIRSVEVGIAAGIGVTAELFDGTDSVDLCWIGRRSVPGVDTGRHLKVTGRIGRKDGKRIMYNPRYELLASRPNAAATA